MNLEFVKKFVKNVRINILYGALNAGVNSAHIGGAMSIAEILSTIYCFTNISPIKIKTEDRDRVILSKGHACLALYGCLVEKKLIKKKDLKLFEKNNGYLFGHPVMNVRKGIEYSTGSLGMGLSLAVGTAISAKLKKKNYKTFVILGDGECNEGSVWEAVMLATQKKLDNLVVFIDKNNFQQTGTTKEILDLKKLKKKWESFGWRASEIDGHNIREIFKSLDFKSKDKPRVIIANTIKGKGFKISENNNDWHHKILTKKDFDAAILNLK